MRNRKQLTYSFLLIIGVLVLVNILSATFFARIDFTEDKRYTLSKATKNILKGLKQPVTVTAYFSKDLPAEMMKSRSDFKDILIEYANLSRNKLVYEFINPSENEQNEQKATQAGVQPVMVNIREKDQIKQQKAYVGAVIKVGEQSEIIPVIQPGAAMEYALSAAIKKLTTTDKASVGILQGNGEPSLAAINQAYMALDVLYNVQPVYLTDTSYTLNKYKTIALIGPKDTIRPSYYQQIDRFISEGGNLFVSVSHVDGNFQNASGFAVNNGIISWLKSKGINITDNFVIDDNCGTVNVQQQQQGFIMNTQVKFPYLPIISNFPKHPITEGLDAVIFQFASPISFTGDSSKKFEPLAYTSEKSGTLPVPLYFDINKQWSANDFPLKNIVVAASIVPKSGKGGKIVVVSNGNFAVNGEGQQNQQPRQINPANVNLMVNAIDWLSDETGLIDLRTKGIKMRPLDQIEEGKKTFLKFLNFLLPILIIIGYGIFRFNRNRSIRVKRMEAHYV
jgi:gliding-associated putative ABC transporter substrate-binding component GldG